MIVQLLLRCLAPIITRIRSLSLKLLDLTGDDYLSWLRWASRHKKTCKLIIKVNYINRRIKKWARHGVRDYLLKNIINFIDSVSWTAKRRRECSTMKASRNWTALPLHAWNFLGFPPWIATLPHPQLQTHTVPLAVHFLSATRRAECNCGDFSTWQSERQSPLSQWSRHDARSDQ